MMRTWLFSLSGIDGSGKTTLSLAAVEDLKKAGYDVHYVYGRYVPFLLRPIIRLCNVIFLRRERRYVDYSAFSTKKKNTVTDHRFLSQIYLKLLMLEYSLQLAINIYYPLKIWRKIIICDRYIIDTIITDIAVDFHYTDVDISRSVKQLYSCFPRPEISYIIDIPEEIAYLRKNDTPAVEYLKERREGYLLAGKEIEAEVIDGTLPLPVIKSKIVNSIMERLNG